MNNTLLLTYLIIILSPALVWAQRGMPRTYEFGEPEIGIVERLDEYIPEDVVIIDVDGNPVEFYSLLDKPTILALVYYRCPGICSPFTEGISDVISRSDLILGKDFQIITVSFDPREGPELARTNRNNYHHLIKKDFDPYGWQFFVADSANIRKLTEAVGFKYKRTGFDFLHTAAMIFIADDGKITRYLHGTYFLTIDLKMAVVETAQGKSGPSFSRVLAFCYSFDPAGQQYVLNITKIAGTLILFFALVIFLLLVMLKPGKQVKS
jgi:protein SCO1